ncbi:MAG: ATP-binding cassette domain-containing protein [Chlamydiae bacterium]|nr:ATP-binding cassette domain-containing protein [Chlamydiota bacterium]
MNGPVIELRKLSKTFPKSKKASLSEIDVSISSGQLIGLVGPDGAGKTTLIRHLAGLLKASSGTIDVLGLNPITQAKELHDNIGYMPQRFGLYEDLTVIQNLSLYADLHGIEEEKKQPLFAELLQFTGLSSFTDRLAKNLSGGMKQKLGLACVLLKKPKLLLLDEPSVGVDPISRRELWKMVTTLVTEHITVIWSTCYLDEAEKCETVLLLNEGKLLFYGSASSYTENMHNKVFLVTPGKEEKRNLLDTLASDPSVIDCTIQGDSLRVVLKEEGSHPILPSDKIMIATPPRFEDAFIHKLSNRIPRSVLAEELTLQVEKNDQVMIEAENLSKQFDHFTAVDRISFSVRQGEIFGLLGPNGAGKSTTFKMLCGLLQPSAGACSVMSLSLQKAPGEARSQIGYMAQKFSLYGDLSAMQNLKFFAGIYPVPVSEVTKVIAEMIDAFDLTPFLSTSAKELPLGFKQRLALACALMHKPKVLFLDEPTSGVDPITRREFWGHINALVKKGMTVMITTHFMDEAEYCDRIGLINKGKLIMIDSPDALKKAAISPDNPTPTLEDAFISLSLKMDNPA